MGRGAGASLAPFLRRVAPRRREPEGYGRAYASLLLPRDSAARAARRARARVGAWQFAACARHGPRSADAADDPEHGTRDGCAAGLSPACRLDGGIERGAGLIVMAEVAP